MQDDGNAFERRRQHQISVPAKCIVVHQVHPAVPEEAPLSSKTLERPEGASPAERRDIPMHDVDVSGAHGVDQGALTRRQEPRFIGIPIQ